jgi:glyoxylase-like metal-dependent hydrolase (beta-lactamase superfamily II)
MGATIHTIPLGIDNVYVVKDKGAVIIDSGAPKKGKAFKKALENVGIKPEEIQLIILTHGHWDHIGSTAEIKEMTGAKVVMHKNEKHWLEEFRSFIFNRQKWILYLKTKSFHWRNTVFLVKSSTLPVTPQVRSAFCWIPVRPSLETWP